MNQLIFDRSTGNLGPHAFARIQSSQLLHAIQPAPRLLFDGRESFPEGEVVDKSWTHQAGVNALSIDIDGKMYDLPLQLAGMPAHSRQTRVWRS
jgi:DNA excision repair protein ERCC-8